MRPLSLAFAISAALPCCALFTPARPTVCPDVPIAPAPSRAASSPPAPPGQRPPTPARPSVTELSAARGFHLRRSMTLAVAPLRIGTRDAVFELLQRMLARRSVRLLDLSRSTELVAKVHGPERDRETSLEGPWLAAVWAARWGGASHVMVSDALAVSPARAGAGVVARGSFRLLALPGAEVVWTARLERAGDTDEDALARVLDALVDALHGTLREEPDADEQPTPAAPPRARRHHRRNRHR